MWICELFKFFFLLFTFYLKLFPMYVHIMSSLPFILRQKREESKMKVLRKFIAIFWPGYQIFSSTDMNFTSIALLLSLFIFKSTFNCKFAIIELVGDDDDHHPYGDECFFLHTFLSITRYDVESFHSKLL